MFFTGHTVRVTDRWRDEWKKLISNLTLCMFVSTDFGGAFFRIGSTLTHLLSILFVQQLFPAGFVCGNLPGVLMCCTQQVAQ